MKIQKITPQIFQTRQLSLDKNNIKETVSNKSEYKTFAYRDYNINFGARLFRTPSNFYEQPFNKEGMPNSMKKYLYEDYEDRKNIPPVQMMKIVFGDINEAENLEEVKELYPDEPLFRNLHSMNDKKYREGILAEIKIMQDENTPIFKNGDNDLGMYILKKIYVEGKTLKEINKDFKKDVSKDFEALSQIDYRTIQQFGISFPDRSFWHSFYVTREDFPYTYTPRKELKSRIGDEKTGKILPSYADINASMKKQDMRNPKFKVKDYEINKLADAIVKGLGDKTLTQKEIKKRFNVKDEKAQFVNRYLSEIMSISLEKIHASDEMRDFFDKYDSLDKSQKKKFEAYWKQNPWMKDLQSIAISDTIKLFFETYGPDGNNDEFQDLLAYAASIKPAREERIRLHNEMQDLYEKELGIFENNANTLESEKSDATQIQDALNHIEEEINTDHYTYNLNGDKVSIIGNFKEENANVLRNTYGDLFPNNFLSKYIRFVNNSPLADDKYLISNIVNKGNFDIPVLKDELLSEEELKDINDTIAQEFFKTFLKENLAAQQAIIAAIYELSDNENLSAMLYKLSPLETYNVGGNLSDIIKFKQETINNKYTEYTKPLSTSEANKIAIEIFSQLRQFTPDKGILFKKDNEEQSGINNYITLLSIICKGKNDQQKLLKSSINNFILKDFGGSSRILLDKNIPDKIKTAKTEQIIISYLGKNAPEFVSLVHSNPQARRFLFESMPENYMNSDLLLLKKMDKIIG